MDREELIALIEQHRMYRTWCYTCNGNVGTFAEHIADLLMPAGVDYLLTAREI